jgi:hypothetical protein
MARVGGLKFIRYENFERKEMKGYPQYLSGEDMKQELIATIMKLMWATTGEVRFTQEEKEQLATRADGLLEMFKRDFIVN